MRPRVKASVLWGLVGALAFLVLAQGYRLAGGRLVGFAVLLAVAAAVGVVVTGVAYVAEGWLARNKRV